ncbi:hypothetical protein KDK95_34080 [Actinospica sp. MGRD01-02]|uniref:ATP-grasp domain-containing protein n=1 Tax=Actinospica acidithermotolerans TaxID=2828514 RepID=A0A941ELR9_9ACTN|nr:hypothetical protein [Actinospica acidithermotolerans]MBR7831384.1 hypothetical protein [Actinospica acidithermotolerans]
MSRNVLFLLAGSLARRHHPWEALDLDGGDTALVIVPPNQGRANAPVPVHVADGYYDNAEVEEIAFDAHGRRAFTHVIELAEDDVERSARLREAFGLDTGMTSDQARTGRDKVLMKKLWRAGAVPTACCAALHEASDLRRFAESAGYPVVVKPRFAVGRAGAVLRDDADRRSWLAANWTKSPFDPRVPAWMVEEQVDGTLLQVDALLTEHDLEYLWPSRVAEQPPGRHGLPALTITTCDPGDPVVSRAQDLARRAIQALRPRPRTAIVHAEMLQRTGDGELLMSELAWRPGGMLTPYMMQGAFGVDPIRRFLDAVLGPGRAASGAVPLVPTSMAGQVGVAHRPGTIAAVHPFPPALRVPTRMLYGEIAAQEGRAYPAAAHRAELAANAVVLGKDTGAVTARQKAVAAYVAGRGLIYTDAAIAPEPAGCGSKPVRR